MRPFALANYSQGDISIELKPETFLLWQDNWLPFFLTNLKALPYLRSVFKYCSGRGRIP